MDLWIRSQDREQLKKIVDLKYQYGTLQDANLKVIVGTTQYDEWDVLGSYETKERALEVLDEIQKLLQPQTIINYESKVEIHPEYTVQNVIKTIPKTEIKELSTYVYEMPID